MAMISDFIFFKRSNSEYIITYDWNSKIVTELFKSECKVSIEEKLQYFQAALRLHSYNHGCVWFLVEYGSLNNFITFRRFPLWEAVEYGS